MYAVASCYNTFTAARCLWTCGSVDMVNGSWIGQWIVDLSALPRFPPSRIHAQRALRHFSAHCATTSAQLFTAAVRTTLPHTPAPPPSPPARCPACTPPAWRATTTVPAHLPPAARTQRIARREGALRAPLCGRIAARLRGRTRLCAQHLTALHCERAYSAWLST